MRRIVTWLTEQSYRKAWLVILSMIVIAGYGAFTFTRVNQELIPDIEFPIMTVIAQSPGMQPEQVAQNVVAPIEAATADLQGLNGTESTSVAGLGVILYIFDFGTSIDDAQASIQESLNQLPLPPDVITSTLAFDPSTLPVLIFDLQGDLSQAQLAAIAQTQIVPEIATLDGVGSVDVTGGAVNEVVITLDRQQLLDRGISYEQVTGTLQANNVILPSGQLLTGETILPIETVAVYRSVEEIEALPLTAQDGTIVPLGELATVENVEGRSVGLARTNGQPSVSIQVVKTASSNTVDVANRAKERLEEIEPNLSDGASISIFFDQAEFITESINGVIEEGIIGGVLAVIIVFLFLWNVRSTLITAVSIPLSVVMAIILLDYFGHSLNIMTLAGLTIAIGRVIDDSIVVLENVYRHMAEGEPSFPAIINGAREVTIAIVGATATTCAVFLPIGLVGGIIGELFLPFALAVVFALLASLLVAVTVVPMLAKYTIAGRVKVEPEKRAGDTRIGRIYTPILTWSLRHRWTTLAIAGLLFVGSLALTPFLNVAFLPDSSENIVTVSVDALPGETQETVLARAIQVEELLDRYDVERYQTTITGASSDIGAIGNIISGNNPNSATMTITLAASEDKQDVADELRQLIADQLPDSENILVSASGGAFSMGGGVAITVSAKDPRAVAELPAFTELLAETVAGVDNVVNVESNIATVQPTIDVLVDPVRAAEAGLMPAQISASLSNISTSQVVTTAQLDTGVVPVRLLMSGGDAQSIEDLEALEIAPGVLLGDVATLTETTKQVTITRVDGSPAAAVTADITSENTGGVSADVQAAVNKLDPPPGVEVLFGGVAGDIDEGFATMFVAILISIVLVYAIMALLFGSWLDPFVILFSLPLAAIGAIVALFVTNTAMSISSLIGILMLVGIVVTNAIVMLEFVIMLRKEQGFSTYDALVTGAQTRLRPILMTAFAAMLALVPLSLGLTEGALIAADLGRTVIGGLFSSTLLTLVVVPVVYSLVDDLKVRFGHGIPQPAHATAVSRRAVAEPGNDA